MEGDIPKSDQSADSDDLCLQLDDTDELFTNDNADDEKESAEKSSENSNTQSEKIGDALPLSVNSSCDVEPMKVDSDDSKQNSEKDNTCEEIQKSVDDSLSNELAKTSITELNIEIKTEITLNNEGKSAVSDSKPHASTESESPIANEVKVKQNEISHNSCPETPTEPRVEDMDSADKEFDSVDRELDSLLGSHDSPNNASTDDSTEISSTSDSKHCHDKVISSNHDSGNKADANADKVDKSSLSTLDSTIKVESEKTNSIESSEKEVSSKQCSQPANNSKPGILNPEEGNLKLEKETKPNRQFKTVKRSAELPSTTEPDQGIKKVRISDSIKETTTPSTSKQTKTGPASSSFLEKPKSPDEIKKIRAELCETYINQETMQPMTIEECEEILCLRVAEVFAHKANVDHIRQMGKSVESEHHQFMRVHAAMKKQIEDMKFIVRKLIEEKNSPSNWNSGVIPKKTVRSVSLQACTVGPISMVDAKHKERENVKELLRRNEIPPNRVSHTEEKPSASGADTEDKDDLIFVSEEPGTSTDPLAQPGSTNTAENIPPTPSVVPSDTTLDLPAIDLTSAEDEPAKATSAGQPARRNQPGAVPGPSPSKSQNPPASSSGTSGSAGGNQESSDQAAKRVPNAYNHLPAFPASNMYPPDVVRPPRPIIKIGRNKQGKQGIMLTWTFDPKVKDVSNISEYQLYACQENTGPESRIDPWKKVGDIKALPLPMACFLTQFVPGHKYHFIVRAVDKRNVQGEFSWPGSIILHSTTSTDAAAPKTK